MRGFKLYVRAAVRQKQNRPAAQGGFAEREYRRVAGL